MTEKRIGAVLGAIALAAGSACAAQQQMGGGFAGRNVGTVISVLPSADTAPTCTVVVKQDRIKSHAERRLTFTVLNFCSDQEVEVMVGNFRRTDATGTPPGNCTQAMYPSGATPIFQQDGENHRGVTVPAAQEDEPRSRAIKLMLRKSAELPEPGTNQIEYDFDVCLGGNKADPRLIIEK